MIKYEGQHDIDPQYYIVGLNPNFEFPLHFHHCFEITLVLEGQMQVQCEKEIYTLSAGDMIFVGSACLHNQKTIGHSKSLIVIFNPNMVASVASNFFNHSLKSPVLKEVDEYYIQTFKKLNDNYMGKKDPIFAKGALYVMMSLFSEQLNFETKINYADCHILLRKIYEFVEKNKESPCTLNSLAETLGYSAGYLSRFFRDHTGIAYHEYVRVKKIDHACYLLKNTSDSILSISIRCGYSSLKSFNKNFRQIVGTNPSDYRKG